MTKIGEHSKVLSYQISISRGEELIDEGPLGECAERRNIKPETLRFYLTPAYERRLGRRKTLDNSIFVVRLDDD